MTRNKTPNITTPNAPNPAASVGVATPKIIKPITQNTMKPIGKTLTMSDQIISLKGAGSTEYSGAASGSSFTCPYISTE